MEAPGCSPSCRQAHNDGGALERELNRRWWVGIAFIAAACAAAYAAYAVTGWFWIPAALATWFGAYQTIYSKGCASCGAPDDNGATGEPPKLTAVQRATRLRMAHRFLAAAIALAAISAEFLPLLWPLAAIAGWFAASFYAAVWTGYAGCPEVGAIPSWLSGRHFATRCGPLERIDALPSVQ